MPSLDDLAERGSFPFAMGFPRSPFSGLRRGRLRNIARSKRSHMPFGMLARKSANCSFWCWAAARKRPNRCFAIDSQAVVCA